MAETRRVAVKLAYDGTRFHGFQKQPELSTVEGELIAALCKVGAISPDPERGLRSSSRTDRGVSALGNVISFETDFRLRSLCPAMNSELEGAWAYSAVEVDGGFNPRWARQRWYRYHLPIASQNLSTMRTAACRMIGTHDFSGFARLDGRSPIRTIESIEITEAPPFFVLDFRAESFLWNMVRRIAWFINAAGEGSVSLDSLEFGPGVQRRRIGLLPPEFLILMDVDCGIDFPVDPVAIRTLGRAMNERIATLDMEREFCRLFSERLD
ncbi:MAG: tRNA pseudouridine(38-40) synthase TruA [Methanobacteriota archaeon]|nr:MAG: tRNA pseudouridine(38-40) synthase TruA [Euryarchaeota archaeon]